MLLTDLETFTIIRAITAKDIEPALSHILRFHSGIDRSKSESYVTTSNPDFSKQSGQETFICKDFSTNIGKHIHKKITIKH